MSDEEKYELQQEHLTPKSQRQQNLLEKAKHTDAAIQALTDGDPLDIIHEIVIKHPELASIMLLDLHYYKSKGSF